MKTIKYSSEGWEKEFDRKFSKWEGGNKSFAPILNAEREGIKSFICQLLNEVREKERNELKEIIETKLKNDPNNPVLIAGLEYVLTILTLPDAPKEK